MSNDDLPPDIDESEYDDVDDSVPASDVLDAPEYADGEAQERDGDVTAEYTTGASDGGGQTDTTSETPHVENTVRDERPTKDESALGKAGAKLLATVPKPILGVRETLFRRLAFKSLENYHDVSGGDALGLVAEPGQNLDVRPIQYRAPKDCEEGERPGWVEKGGDKVWHAGAEGRVVDYLGDTPIVALERDGHVEAGWLKPRIGQAIELDNYDGLFTNPQIQAPLVTDPQTSINAANGNGTPDASTLADGGQNVLTLNIEDIGQYQGAEVVDLDSGGGYDGMRVDFRKASQWAFETTATEQMQMQEERGRLMGLLNGDDTNVTRLFLYACLFALAVIGLVTLGPQLVGGGGGGGSINPLMLLGGI